MEKQQLTWSDVATNVSKHNERQKVLAQFISSHDLSRKGWWYCLPELRLNNDRRLKPLRLVIDQYLPQLGFIFGIEEEMTAIILYEMGLLKYRKKSGLIMNQKGWDDLKSCVFCWVTKCVNTPKQR